MNVKLISKALHTLSLLSDEDYDLVLKLRALTEDERGLLMTVLEPSKPATKKASRKPSKSSSKSPRATGIEQQLSKRREQGRAGTTKDDNYDGGLCLAGIDSKGETCGEPADHNVHHLNSHPDYHPFVPDVRAAPTRSPANGGAINGIQNSEAEKAVAGAATGGSSE